MTSGLVPGAINFRDTGGLPAGDGATRSGQLFRSGQLSRLGPEGRAALGALGLRRVIDLRDDDEVAREPSGLDHSVRVQRVPLFLGSVASFFAEDLTLPELYLRIVDDAAPGVVDVVRGVVEDQPVLVHCTVGKDRTGVTVALTLAAAGVDDDAVVADYALTETLLPAGRNRAVLAWLRAQHPASRTLEELATRSPAPVMQGLLARLSERYGSPVGYLEAHGLRPDEVAELRRILIVRTG